MGYVYLNNMAVNLGGNGQAGLRRAKGSPGAEFPNGVIPHFRTDSPHRSIWRSSTVNPLPSRGPIKYMGLSRQLRL